MLPSTVSELERAGATLLGVAPDAVPERLRQLTLRELRNHYRRLLIAAHPERAHRLGLDPTEAEERFKEVGWAYRVLRRHLAYRAPPGCPPAPTIVPAVERRAGAATATGGQARWLCASSGPGLRFGEWLVTSGVIGWPTLQAALAGQRRTRPRLLDLGVTVRLLDEGQARMVRRQQRRGELSGQAAVRLGVLGASPCLRLLALQRQLQARLGRYLCAHGLCDEAAVEALHARYLLARAQPSRSTPAV